MKLATITTITQDSVARLGELTKSLKAWNLLTAIYGDTADSNSDLLAAYARQSREVVLESIKQTHRLALMAFEDDQNAFDEQLARLDVLDHRERRLSKLFSAELKEQDKRKQQDAQH